MFRFLVPAGNASAPDRAAAQQLFDALTMGVLVQDGEGCIAAANPAAVRILGLAAEEVVGRTITDPRWRWAGPDGAPFPPVDHPAHRALRTGGAVPDVLMGVHNPLSGGHRWINTTSVPVFAEGPSPIGVYTIFEDITERRETERALQARVVQQEAVGRLQQMALSNVPLDELFGAAVEAVRSTLRGLFAAVLESLGHGAFRFRRVSGELLPPAPLFDAAGDRSLVATAFAADAPVIVQDWAGEARFDTPRRLEARRIRSSMSVAIPGAGARFGVLGVHSDAPGRFDAQAIAFLEAVAGVLGAAIQHDAARAAQHRSEERFRVAAECGSDAIVEWDVSSGKVSTFGNLPAVSQPARQFTLQDWMAAVAPEDVPRLLASLDRHGRAGTTFSEEYRMLGVDGETVEVLTRGRLLPGVAGRPGRWIFTCTDVTERRRAARALREANELFNAVIEGTSDAIFIKDLQGRYRLINTAGASRIGRTVAEVIGRSDFDLFPPELAARYQEVDRQVIASGQVDTFDDAGRGPEPGRHNVTSKMPHRDSTGAVIGVIGIARDVTEQRALEDQFRQVQKMEAIGRLAGGIAHDFNNLLTVILGYAEVLERGDPGQAEAGESAVEIRKAAERAALLTRQLLAFSRRQVLQPRVLDVNWIVANTDRMLRRIVGEDITFRTVLSTEAAHVKVDAGQIEQVLLNLVVNAREAMPRGGAITIETACVTFEREVYRKHPGTLPGDYVMIAVSDTGAGMDRETLARAFEPFFTTKGLEGTGLGLSTVYGVVKQSGGEVWAYSEPGRGTSVKVYLPRVMDPAVEELAAAPLPVVGGAERVLVVEDERAVRQLLTASLARLGYEVLEAEDGEHAISLLRGQPRPFDLLITDIVMPGINGRELAEAVTGRMPGTRVLFVSGYADHAAIADGLIPAGQHFLQKPFTAARLAAKVREILDA